MSDDSVFLAGRTWEDTAKASDVPIHSGSAMHVYVSPPLDEAAEDD